MWKFNAPVFSFAWGRCGMASRLKLQELLEELLGSNHVYFQPPSDITMQYPCILYVRDDSKTEFAGNSKYLHTKRYQVTVVDRDPDTELSDKVEALPLCAFDRFYAADGLNHFVFTLFF
jgi:hypothetical protein